METQGKIDSASVKQLAFEMGFHQVGVTSFTGLREAEPALQEWIQEGRHGTMKYLADFKKRREQLIEKCPGAKSVIVLAVNYYSTGSKSARFTGDAYRDEKPGTFGTGSVIDAVALYAQGRDYHEVIQGKHKVFIGKLRGQLQIPFQAVSCVDIQPVPERFAAVRAGLGFIGKHTGLLSREFGPWLFLSEIVTDLDLVEDSPAVGDCGSCRKCQVACPTKALDQDYRIDARLCLAYLTIEHKGAIPEELRSKVGNRIFGCDECLKACPFTSYQKKTSWPEFLPESGVGPRIDFEKLFSLPSNRAYEKCFAHTALTRTGKKQMLRNVCIVMGNSGDKAYLPFLEKVGRDESSLVREHASWALAQIQTASPTS
ncbi:MAG: tRNA epoxyqueuosine(34) reductase QueG [Candidatus Omnitrophica bacterium]|nr:tRNA epoxyqueuosine(34) reductase QueG [Candidatus Omnitrophota bacterium]